MAVVFDRNGRLLRSELCVAPSRPKSPCLRPLTRIHLFSPGRQLRPLELVAVVLWKHGFERNRGASSNELERPAERAAGRPRRTPPAFCARGRSQLRGAEMAKGLNPKRFIFALYGGKRS